MLPENNSCNEAFYSSRFFDIFSMCLEIRRRTIFRHEFPDRDFFQKVPKVSRKRKKFSSQTNEKFLFFSSNISPILVIFSHFLSSFLSTFSPWQFIKYFCPDFLPNICRFLEYFPFLKFSEFASKLFILDRTLSLVHTWERLFCWSYSIKVNFRSFSIISWLFLGRVMIISRSFLDPSSHCCETDLTGHVRAQAQNVPFWKAYDQEIPKT